MVPGCWLSVDNYGNADTNVHLAFHQTHQSCLFDNNGDLFRCTSCYYVHLSIRWHIYGCARVSIENRQLFPSRANPSYKHRELMTAANIIFYEYCEPINGRFWASKKVSSILETSFVDGPKKNCAAGPTESLVRHRSRSYWFSYSKCQ